MAFHLSWTIEGDKQLSRNLLLASDRIKDWSPAFHETADYLLKIFSRDVFSSQGEAIEEHWAPLSRAYAYRKAKRYPGKPLLEATGKMKNSFVTLWRGDQAAIWNTAEYFKYHQSNQARSKMPRRVMMKLARAQQTQIVRIFNTYFSRVVHG